MDTNFVPVQKYPWGNHAGRGIIGLSNELYGAIEYIKHIQVLQDRAIKDKADNAAGHTLAEIAIPQSAEAIKILALQVYEDQKKAAEDVGAYASDVRRHLDMARFGDGSESYGSGKVDSLPKLKVLAENFTAVFEKLERVLEVQLRAEHQNNVFKTLRDAHEAALLRESGYSSFAYIKKRSSDLFLERCRLSAKPFGQWLYAKRIKRNLSESAVLEKALTEKSVLDNLYTSPCSSSRSLLILKQQAVELLKDKISEAKETIFSVEFLRCSKEADSLLTGEIGHSLAHIYLQSTLFHPLADEMKNFSSWRRNFEGDFGCQQPSNWLGSALIAKAATLARIVFHEGVKISKADNPRLNQLWNDFRSLPDAVSRHIANTVHYPPTDQVKGILARLLAFSSPVFQGNGGVLSVTEELFDQEFVNNYDHMLWSLVTKNQIVIDFLGQDILAAAESKLAESVAKKLIGSAEHENATIEAGWRLINLKNMSLAPYVILNAYREPGYSGEQPFISVHCSDGRKTLLAQYILKLSEADLKLLASYEIDGVLELIATIRTNPKTFRMHHLPHNDKNLPWSKRENPVQKKILECIERMVLHYLRKGTEEEQYFVIGVIENATNQISPQIGAELAGILTSTTSAKLKQEILDLVVNKGASVRQASALLAASLLRHLVATADFAVSENKPTIAAKLFKSLFRSELSAEVADNIATLTNHSVKEIQSAHRLLSWLYDEQRDARLLWSDPYDTYNGDVSKTLQQCIDAASADGFMGVLTTLDKYGYGFSLKHTSFIPQLVESLSWIEHDILDIRRIEPDFNYIPIDSLSEDKSFGRGFSPFSILLRRFDRGQRLGLFTRIKRTFGEIPPDYCSKICAALREELSVSRNKVEPGQSQWLHCAINALMKIEEIDATTFESVLIGLSVLSASAYKNLEAGRCVDSILLFCKRAGDGGESALRCALPLWAEVVVDESKLQGLLERLHHLVSQGINDPSSWSQVEKLVILAREQGMLANGGDKEISLITSYIDFFGIYIMPRTFMAWRRLAIGEELSPELILLGITQTGPHGVAELQKAFRAFRAAMIDSESVFEVKSEFGHEWLEVLSRLKDTQWRRDSGTKEIVQSFNEKIGSGKIAPLSTAFTRGTLEVEKIDAQALSGFRFSEPCKYRYAQLQHEILAVRSKPATDLLAQTLQNLVVNIKEEIAQLESPLTAEEIARDKQGRRKKGREVEANRLHKFLEHEALTPGGTLTERQAERRIGELIGVLADFEKKDSPTTTAVLRQLLVYKALSSCHGSANFSGIPETPLSKSSLATAVEFLENVLAEHGLRGITLTKTAKSRVLQVSSTRALTDDIDRISNLAASGFEKWGMLPTRGILLELSGYLADACWTRVTNIGEKHPNLVAVPFVRSPGELGERLAGCTLLIKTKTANGKTAMVIRGFNPLQNCITRIKAGDFFEKFVAWLEPIARKEGADYILIPAGTSGGSQTNRPEVSAYLSHAYKDAPIVPLASTEDTTFNGYNIVNSCVLVRDLG